MATAPEIIDNGPRLIGDLFSAFASFCQSRGRVTEADTRANILDRLIHDILLWPREAVHRETFVRPGFLDYELRVARPTLVIEAKATDVSFTIPFQKRTGSRRLRLSGALRTNKELWDAIGQVQRYSVDQGARYAVVTNGYSFVIFQALSEGRPWRSGVAVVFNGPKDIEDDFTTFWNLLSYDAVTSGGLDNHFRGADAAHREYHVPIAKLLEADATYGRNPLTVALHPYVERFFGDIGSQNTIDILTHCYIYSRPTQVIDSELSLVIRDQIPDFASNAEQVLASEDAPAGNVGDHIRSLVDHVDRGSVVVLMGGIGSGKSTFLKRFFKVVAPDIVFPKGRAVLVYLDFLGQPDSPTELDSFVWANVAERLTEQDSTLSHRGTLEQVFAKKLALARELFKSDPDTLERRIASQLYDFASNSKELALGVLAYLPTQNQLPVVVFDNVDQLSVSAQTTLFTLAQHFALHLGCLSILVLREESYCTAQMQKQLTAYTIRPFHLSSPSFSKLIQVRLDFAANDAARQTEQSVSDRAQSTSEELLQFFHVLREAVFNKNRNIIRLVESVSFGNMRLALSLFNNFITSGATNLPKILAIYREYGRYIVPFHEFIKSVMLGEYRYYKETRSALMNAFHATTARNASHFTTLRLLRYLGGPYDASKSGEEFVGLDSVISGIVTTFDNEDDCVKTIARLTQLNRQLIELDTRRTDSLVGASAVRITTSGRYYMEYLVNSFAYLDLVWQDTAFAVYGVAESLQKSINRTDVELRFERVEAFLDYLNQQERRELASRNLPVDGENFYGPFVSHIRSQYVRERAVIRARARRLGEYGEVESPHSAKSA